MSVYHGINALMQSFDQRRLLGEFVRAHRERLPPEDKAGRRRTPGLRREELAARAGISATWCTWIEQGREVRASPQALGRLAQALQLSRAERAYLFELAGRRDPAAGDPALADAPSSVEALVGLLQHPAYGLDALYTVTCWNEAAADLFADWSGRAEERNLLRFIFLHPGARRLIPDWAARARRVVAEFRADFGYHAGDPRARGMVEALRRDSSFFAAIWDELSVSEREGGLRGFNHPTKGFILYTQLTFSPAERPDHKLVILVPA